MLRLTVLILVLGPPVAAAEPAAVDGVGPPRLAKPWTFDTGDDGPRDLGLVRRDDGSHIYVDPGHRFTMTVMPDGRVQFADRWRRPDARDPQRGRCCGRPSEGLGRGFNPFMGAPFGGPLEWMLRRRGEDPSGAAKADVLARTLPLRIQIAIAWHHNLLQTRVRDLRSELDRLWRDPELPQGRKKAVLFTRWDECEDRFDVATEGLPEQAVGPIDAARQETADRARVLIERFVRLRAPRGSRHAFSPSELERFNRDRVSKRRFDPYQSSS